MEPASPARLYATAVGTLLVLLGIVGFFYGSSFGSPGALDHTLGALTLAFTTPERRLPPADFVLARDLAARAAVALDNARLIATVEAPTQAA